MGAVRRARACLASATHDDFQPRAVPEDKQTAPRAKDGLVTPVSRSAMPSATPPTPNGLPPRWESPSGRSSTTHQAAIPNPPREQSPPLASAWSAGPCALPELAEARTAQPPAERSPIGQARFPRAADLSSLPHDFIRIGKFLQKTL